MNQYASIDAEIAQQNARLARETGLTTITDRQAGFMILAKRFGLEVTRNEAEGLVTDYLERAEVFASQEA
ncbi:MAG TPA: hypothetical protein PLO16_14985 [Acidocella sp.]|nr:hypothetical protein [Acidocella sp.]